MFKKIANRINNISIAALSPAAMAIEASAFVAPRHHTTAQGGHWLTTKQRHAAAKNAAIRVHYEALAKVGRGPLANVPSLQPDFDPSQLDEMAAEADRRHAEGLTQDQTEERSEEEDEQEEINEEVVDKQAILDTLTSAVPGQGAYID